MAVLSRSLDLSTSEDDSSYLEPGESQWEELREGGWYLEPSLSSFLSLPVVLDEVKPKFVKGAKRYGRRSRPDSGPDTAETSDSATVPPSAAEGGASLSPGGVRQAKLRRSTSLESVEVRSFGRDYKTEPKAGTKSLTVKLMLKSLSSDRKVNLYSYT